MQTPESRLSLFPMTPNCNEIEKLILSFVPKKDLFACAKVSKTWCFILDALTQSSLSVSKIPFKNKKVIIPLLNYCLTSVEELDLDEKTVKKELKSLSKHLYLGFYSNLTLYRIGKESKVEIFVNALAYKLGDASPRLILALEYLQNDEFDSFQKICQHNDRIFFNHGDLIDFFIEKMCQKNKLKNAIEFYKTTYCEEIHYSEMITSLERIKNVALEQQDLALLEIINSMAPTHRE